MGPLANHVRRSLQNLREVLPGHYDRLEEGLMSMRDVQAQQQFIVMAHNMQQELKAAERRGAQRFQRTGRVW